MLLNFCKGACMGAADVVPGVSGGTMALVLGIYERLLRAIRRIDMPWLAMLARGRIVQAIAALDLELLVPLALGIAAALGFFTRIVPLPRLIVTHPEPVYGLFFGLIAASAWALLQGLRPLGGRAALWLVTGTLAGLAVVNLVPMQTPDDAWFIFVCGVVAISAMLLPGISGSFILLLLQKYAYIFDAVGRLDLAVLTPFALGCLVGLALFSRVITWLLARFYRATLLVITGVLVGSLWIVWPFQDRVYATVRDKPRLVGSEPTVPDVLDASVATTLVMAVLGVAIVVLIHRAARNRRASI